MVQFCPRAQSPKLIKQKVKKFGYSMMYENRDCRNWWWRLHKHCTGRRCNTARDCAVAARKVGAKYFLFGKRRWGRGRPRCYANKKNDGKCTFKKRPWMRRKVLLDNRLSTAILPMKLFGKSSANQPFKAALGTRVERRN